MVENYIERIEELVKCNKERIEILNDEIKAFDGEKKIKDYDNFIVELKKVSELSVLCNLKFPKIMSKKSLDEKLKRKFRVWKGDYRDDQLFEFKKIIHENEYEIANLLNTYKRELYSNSREYKSIERFIIRKGYIYYMNALVRRIESFKEVELKALIYNIKEQVKNIKNDDSWILCDNQMKEYFQSESDIKWEKYKKIDFNHDKQMTEDEKLVFGRKRLLESLLEIGHESNSIKFIVELKNTTNIMNALETDDELRKMVEDIDKLLIDFIDFYGETDNKQIYLDELVDIKEVFERLGYEFGMMKSFDKHRDEASKLDLSLCETLEVIKTKDISKEFLIKEIFRKAILKDENGERKVVRKAIVSVYRFDVGD